MIPIRDTSTENVDEAARAVLGIWHRYEGQEAALCTLLEPEAAKEALVHVHRRRPDAFDVTVKVVIGNVSALASSQWPTMGEAMDEGEDWLANEVARLNAYWHERESTVEAEAVEPTDWQGYTVRAHAIAAKHNGIEDRYLAAKLALEGAYPGATVEVCLRWQRDTEWRALPALVYDPDGQPMPQWAERANAVMAGL